MVLSNAQLILNFYIPRGKGFDTETDVDFIRFLRYGFRSTTEVQSHLYVALDQKYISKDEFTKIYSAAEEVKSLISGFIRYLKS